MYDYGDCVLDYCDKPARTKVRRLCVGHEYQRRNGTPLAPLRQWKVADIGIEGYRRCTKCDKIKEVDQFYDRAFGRGGKHGQCIDCVRKYQNDRNKALRDARNNG